VVTQVFGAGAFETIFGDVTDLPLFQTIFKMIDSRDGTLAAAAHTNDSAFKAEQQKALKAEEEARCRRLSVFLLSNLDGRGKDRDMFIERARAEAVMLVDTPGGIDLCKMVAFIYTQEGTQFRGGIVGMASEISEKAHYTYEGTGILTQAFGVMRAAQKLQPEEAEAGAMTSKDAVNENLQNLTPEELAKVQQEVMAQGLDTLWRLGKLLLEERLRTVCEMALEDAHKECPPWYERAGEFFTTGGLSTVLINELADSLCLLGETFYEVVSKKTEDEDEDADHTGFAQLKSNPNPDFDPNYPFIWLALTCSKPLDDSVVSRCSRRSQPRRRLARELKQSVVDSPRARARGASVLAQFDWIPNRG